MTDREAFGKVVSMFIKEDDIERVFKNPRFMRSSDEVKNDILVKLIKDEIDKNSKAYLELKDYLFDRGKFSIPHKIGSILGYVLFTFVSIAFILGLLCLIQFLWRTLVG